MNLRLIKQYCERRPGGLRQLAEEAGMSEANLHRCIRNNKIQASDLEALSQLLNVKIGIFFRESANAIEAQANGLYGDVAWLHEKIEMLEQRIKDKDATIAEKDKRIADKDELIKLLKEE